MHILVTGGSGRLGRSVVTTLAARGDDVTSVDRTPLPDLPATQVTIDLLDADATEELFAAHRFDAVIHLAAIAVPFSEPERQILTTNTTLAFTVFDAATRHGVPLILAASSPTVLGYGSPTGWTADRVPLDETHPRKPWNAYALSKVIIEDLIAMFVRQSDGATHYGIFRPCFVLSPEEWAGAPTQQGHTIVDRLADPALAAVSLFNYVDARDAADFVSTWLDRARDVPSGECFFVGADDALAVAPVAELTSLVPSLGPAASSLTGSAPVFSSDKAARMLGWRPTRSWRTELPTEALESLGVVVEGTGAADSPDAPDASRERDGSTTTRLEAPVMSTATPGGFTERETR